MTPLQQAATFLQQGKLREAEAIYRELLQTDPANGMALWGLGRIAAAVQHYDAAIATLSQAAQALPDNHLPLLDLAMMLESSGRHGDAGSVYQLVRERLPDDKQVRILHVQHMIGAGDLDRSVHELQSLLADHSDFVPAWFLLSGLKRFTEHDPDMAAMAALLSQPGIGKEQQMQLHYALGKARHDGGDWEQAFLHFEQANQLDQARADFGVQEMAGFFGQLREVFDGALLGQVEPVTRQGITPIFIVGQARSGSTLLEQMLAGHSEMATVGEVSFLGDTIAGGLKQYTGKGFPGGCSDLTAEQREEMAEAYLERLRGLQPEATFVIDKLPANFQSIGMIRLLLPQARVLHLRRDPMDVCFSIYRHHFQANEPFFSSQQAIGAYHGYYEEMMAHWNEVLPEFVHTLHYEDLVTDPEAVLRQALSFCGLGWQEDCLEYTSGQRHISTLSQSQVRGPLDQKTGGAWRNYGESLRPLLEAVGRF